MGLLNRTGFRWDLFIELFELTLRCWENHGADFRLTGATHPRAGSCQRLGLP